MITKLARLLAALLAASTVAPPAPAHAGTAILDTFDVPVASQIVWRVYPAGVYTITAWGTYNYNTRVPGSLADAYCSTAGPGNPFDQSTKAFGLTPSPIAAWEPHRYAMLAPGGDPLELEVNGVTTQWVPMTPTPVSNDPRVGPPGVGSLCNEASHTYTTTVVSVGGPMMFRVFDPEPSDNAGTLTVTVSG